MSEHTITKRKLVTAPIVKRGIPRAGGASTKMLKPGRPNRKPSQRPPAKPQVARAKKRAPVVRRPAVAVPVADAILDAPKAGS